MLIAFATIWPVSFEKKQQLDLWFFKAEKLEAVGTIEWINAALVWNFASFAEKLLIAELEIWLLVKAQKMMPGGAETFFAQATLISNPIKLKQERKWT